MIKKWQSSEIEELKKLADEKTNKELANMFNVTLDSIEGILNRQKIKRKNRQAHSIVINVKEIEYKIDSNNCWICTSHKANNCNGIAYPRVTRNGKVQTVAKFMFLKYKGQLPEGHLIRHKCDNPLCINPEHLETGTHEDNMRDKVERNRCASLKGSDNPSAKLTEDKVLEIRKLLLNNSRHYVAKLYNY